MKKYLSLITFAVMAIFSLTSCGRGGGSVQGNAPTSSNEVSENSSKSMASDNTSSEDDVTTWFYTKNEDDLTHDVTSLNATIISKDYKRFDSYGNTARLALQLSYNASMSASGEPMTSVMFTFTDDNNLCRYSNFQGSGILVVFDNGEVDDSWSLINMTSKRNSLYMYDGKKVMPFIQKLKSSKTARIQVNLENVGKTTFTFNTAGLNWDFPN
ncbi:MAG: hypothetical protein PUE80_07005 [bacterium]|nr:hypothetical protein [bacterium]